MSDSSASGPTRFWLLVAGGVCALASWLLASVKLAQREMATGWIGQHFPPPLIDVLVNSFVYGGLLAIAGFMTWIMPLSHREQRMRPMLAFPFGFVIGLGGVVLALLLIAAGHHLVHRGDTALVSAGLLLVGSAMTLFEALAEEICFRAWLMRRLMARIGAPGAVTAAAIAFSLLHIFGGSRSGISLANIFLAGLLFGVLAWRTGSVWTSVAAHFGWNWGELSLFGLTPNPGVQSFGALFNFDITGLGLWGGSTEGLNSSIAVTIVMVCLLLPLFNLAGFSESETNKVI